MRSIFVRRTAYPVQRVFCTPSQNGPRQRPTTAEFKGLYAKRAGIEGDVAQAVIALDVRHARYSGLAKTHLQAIATAVTVNFKRLVAWLNAEPLAPTRRLPLLLPVPDFDTSI